MLEHADALYLQSTPGIADLPRDCRAAIQAARLIYAEIGHQLVRSGLNSVDQRTVVSASRKMALIGQAQLQAVWDKTSTTSPPPLEGIRFLVEACQHAAAPSHALPQGFPNRSISERILWMINLFERLGTERRQQSMVRQTMHYGPG
jgi:phytoene synthase